MLNQLRETASELREKTERVLKAMENFDKIYADKVALRQVQSIANDREKIIQDTKREVKEIESQGDHGPIDRDDEIYVQAMEKEDLLLFFTVKSHRATTEKRILEWRANGKILVPLKTFKEIMDNLITRINERKLDEKITLTAKQIMYDATREATEPDRSIQ